MARRMRDYHWQVMEKINRLGTAWCCWWDKAGRFRNNCPDDVITFGLIGAMEFLEWTKRHPDWWQIGEWSDERYAAPVSLTDAGREALANRHIYDMEPVTGGMVEPGWQAVPAERVKECEACGGSGSVNIGCIDSEGGVDDFACCGTCHGRGTVQP